MGKTEPKIPGEEDTLPSAVAAVQGEEVKSPKAGTTELNNIASDTPNSVGADRENLVRAQAMAAAAAKGEVADLAPPAAIGEPAQPTSVKRKVMIGGQLVDVEMPIIRKNDAVEKFGPESRHPPGTLVNKDGSVFEGQGNAYGVIGHINTPQGKLVNRILPLDAVQAAA